MNLKYLTTLLINTLLILPSGYSNNISNDTNNINDTNLGSNDDFLYNNAEYKLRKKLFENYDLQSRPIIKRDKPVVLKMGVAIRAFNSIDQVAGTITSNVWLRYYWKDEHLIWVPEKFNNINKLTVNTNPEYDNPIWIPDIYLYNTAEMPQAELDYSKAILYNYGNIIWSRPGIIKSTCIFDLTLFPYDTQTFHLKFGSWSYHDGDIKLQPTENAIDISNYQLSDSWMLKNYSIMINTKKYDCCPENYSDITFNFTMTRKAGYYNLNIIVPTFATATLMIISLLVPWNSGERISFAITVMLSIIVFLLILSENLPKSDSKPLLSVMLIGLTFFSLFVVFFTVIISYMYSYDDDKKNWLMTLLDKYSIIKRCKKNNENNNNNYPDLEWDNGNEILHLRDLKKVDTQGNTIDLDEVLKKNEHLIRASSLEEIKSLMEDETLSVDTVNELRERKKSLIKDECKNLAGRLDHIFTGIFLLAFVIYCSVIFAYIPRSD